MSPKLRPKKCPKKREQASKIAHHAQSHLEQRGAELVDVELTGAVVVKLREVGDDVLVRGLEVLEHAVHRDRRRVPCNRGLLRLGLLDAVDVGVERRAVVGLAAAVEARDAAGLLDRRARGEAVLCAEELGLDAVVARRGRADDHEDGLVLGARVDERAVDLVETVVHVLELDGPGLALREAHGLMLRGRRLRHGGRRSPGHTEQPTSEQPLLRA